MSFSISNRKFQGFKYGKPERRSWVIRAKATEYVPSAANKHHKIYFMLLLNSTKIPFKRNHWHSISGGREPVRGARAHSERARILGTQLSKPFVPPGCTPSCRIFQPACARGHRLFAWARSGVQGPRLSSPSC